MFIQKFFYGAIQDLRLKLYLKNIQTPLEVAVTEIQKRRNDKHLLKEVNEFLNGDIPPHFQNDLPIFYLSRYLATPDYETLQFIESVKKIGFPVVIGEDPDDIFTSHSSLKRNLVKLPIVVGTAKNGSEMIKYETIANFNTEQGKKLRDVNTYHQIPLSLFHRNLASNFFPADVSIVDESAWVHRHSRGKLVKLYESLLALLLTHGIMLEHYELKEIGFLKDVVLPAFDATHKRFGLTPFIVPLATQRTENIHDLNTYPAAVSTKIHNMTHK